MQTNPSGSPKVLITAPFLSKLGLKPRTLLFVVERARLKILTDCLDRLLIVRKEGKFTNCKGQRTSCLNMRLLLSSHI